MRKAKTISKDDKLCFALDYLIVQKQYQKNKKRRNITTIITAVVASACVVMGLASYLPVAVGTAIFGSMILVPSMYVFNSKMREIIDTSTRSNITYKQFKQMERSGELETLIQEAKALQSAPAYVGIPKFSVPVTSASTVGGASQQHANTTSKNNDGRNA